MSTQQDALDAEKDLIQNPENVPKYIWDKAQETIAEGISTAIGKNEKYGWFILVTGQGPMFIFKEKN